MISPVAHDYCETCNRVRLSADGRLMIDLRMPLRAGRLQRNRRLTTG